jgi:hypothetical protein
VQARISRCGLPHSDGGARRCTATTRSIPDRVDALAWSDLTAQLNDRGFALTPPLLTAAECDDLAALIDGGRFRSTIDMARHRFGDGRYRVGMRHGVSTVTRGSRTALGVIFHDAR